MIGSQPNTITEKARLPRARHARPRERARRSTGPDSLLAEFDADARDTSVVWGEVLASAVFEPELRDQLKDATEAWNALVADALGADPDAAERLTALVDGLSARWLAGLMSRERARELLAAAIAAERA